jgi:NADH-quinone oxidoreductase subunit H
VIYLLTIPSLAVVIGGASSSNPHGAAGASREMKLILSYELPFVLAMVPAMIVGGWSLRLGDIVAGDAGTLQSIALIIGFIVGLLCIQAKLGLVPFDIAEAECEIMGGVYVEYSGAPLAVLYLTRAAMLAVLPMVLVTVFWGALCQSIGGALVWILLYLLAVVVTVLVRNTNPRLRIDHTMKFFWFGLTPVAILAVVLALL